MALPWVYREEGVSFPFSEGKTKQKLPIPLCSRWVNSVVTAHVTCFEQADVDICDWKSAVVQRRRVMKFA